MTRETTKIIARGKRARDRKLGTRLWPGRAQSGNLVLQPLDVIADSLVPRPSPSSVRNARAQFNAGVEKRREKAWTNFTRDP